MVQASVAHLLVEQVWQVMVQVHSLVALVVVQLVVLVDLVLEQAVSVVMVLELVAMVVDFQVD